MKRKRDPAFLPNGRPFSDCIDMDGAVQFNIDGASPGALILSKDDKRENPRFVFAFSCAGISTTLPEDEAEIRRNQLTRGLKSLPPGEEMTWYMKLSADDRSRQAELDALRQTLPDSLLKLGVYSQKARTRQLTAQGKRQNVSLVIYVTVTPFQSGGRNRSPVEKSLATLQDWCNALQPADTAAHHADLKHLFRLVFNDGYQLWVNLLVITMGLSSRPLTAEALWADASRRVSPASPGPIPQLLTFDGTDLHEEIRAERHPALHLARHGVPEATPSYVKIDDRYTGAVTMLEKPDGWASPDHQLRAVWDCLNRPEVTDTELVVQVTPREVSTQTAKLQLMTRQTKGAAERAGDQNSVDVGSELNAAESVEAQERLHTGETTVTVAVVALVHRSSPQALATACRRLCHSFSGQGLMQREEHVASAVWLQAQPVVWCKLLVFPAFDQTLCFLSDEAPGLLPVVKTGTHDAQGFELIADEGGSPVHLDFYDPHPILSLRMGLVLGATRSGKSVLVGQILLEGLMQRMPVTVVDYVKPDGSSTYSTYTQLLDGAYFDVTQHSNNLLEMPDLTEFKDPKDRAVRSQQYLKYLFLALMALIVGSKPSDRLPVGEGVIKTVLKQALNEFFKDACITKRYRDAYQDGFGSPAWRKMPTLWDFWKFCRDELSALRESSPQAEAALDFICLQLKGWIDSPGLGQAISKPSSIRTDARIVVFAMANGTDDDEAAVIAIIALAQAMRRSLSAKTSLLFYDEASISCKYPGVSLMIGQVCANGGKAGIRTILAAQDPDTIARSAAGSQIVQNVNTHLIGCVRPAAVPSFEQFLGYPRALIARNASEGFFPNPQGLYSQWLLNDGGAYTWCRFYPSPMVLALTANNPDEQEARNRILAAHPGRPLEGLAVFSRLLVEAIQSGKPLSDITDRWLFESQAA